MLTRPEVSYAKTQQIADRRAEFYSALRSGNYSQGTQMLHNSNNGHMCCLGVACDVSGFDNWEDWEDNSDVMDLVTALRYLNESCVAPAAVLEYYGFPSGSGDVSLYSEAGGWSSAVEMNDGNRDSFQAIADAFEKTYPAKVAP